MAQGPIHANAMAFEIGSRDTSVRGIVGDGIPYSVPGAYCSKYILFNDLRFGMTVAWIRG